MQRALQLGQYVFINGSWQPIITTTIPSGTIQAGTFQDPVAVILMDSRVTIATDPNQPINPSGPPFARLVPGQPQVELIGSFGDEFPVLEAWLGGTLHAQGDGYFATTVLLDKPGDLTGKCTYLDNNARGQGQHVVLETVQTQALVAVTAFADVEDPEPAPTPVPPLPIPPAPGVDPWPFLTQEEKIENLNTRVKKLEA